MISVPQLLRRWFALCCALTGFVAASSAQNANVPSTGAPFSTPPGATTSGARNSNVRLLTLDGPDVSALRALNAENADSNAAIDAISLGASLPDMRADAEATQALMQWVQDGGVVFLHTDAAQLFGYRTVPARETTPDLAGQRFGRAEAALPLGINPLLWAQGSANPAILPGVRVVFYQMAPGDHLVVSHPTGVPLLQVTDLAAPQRQALFASCAASYGSGWAVFTPYFVEQNRADGGVFVRNLLTLVRERPRPGTRPAASRNMATWVAVPAATIDAASNNATHSFDPANWVRPFSVAALGWNEDEETPQNPLQTTLFITQREANGIARLLDRGRNDAPSRVRAQALLILLRARLEWQRGNDRAAQSWMAAAGRVSSSFAETLLWRGVDALNNAEDLTLPTADRVAWWRAGANFLSASLRAQSLLNSAFQAPASALPSPAGSTNGTDAQNAAYSSTQNSAIAGAPRALIQSWVTSALVATSRAVNAPSSAEVIEDSDSLVVLRHENGAGLNYFANDARRLAGASGAAGIWLPRQELWVFPDIVEYNRFRQLEGLGAQNLESAYDVWTSGDEWNSFPQDLLPGGFVPESQTIVVRRRASRSYLGGVQSDALSTRIFTVAPRSPLPRISPNIVRVLSNESLVPLGELHGRALVDAVTQDGAPVPAWMEIGIALMTERQMADDRWNSVRRPSNIVRASSSPERNLVYYNRQGWLLNATQFQSVPTDGSASTVVKEQALGMMLYFYREFGAGAVVETLQRIGSGQSADQALFETTGLNEAQFFTEWGNALFNNDNSRRNRRNR